MRIVESGMKTVTTDYMTQYPGEWFYPVYHGSTQESLKIIYDVGFKDWTKENFHERRHGFRSDAEWDGVPPPVHFLGVGTYFTYSRSSARNYAFGTTRNLKTFAIEVDDDRICEINFGSDRTMMKWWRSYGYDPEKYGREEATWIMTENLQRHWDVVYFRGKGFRGSLLDGNQLCVFDNHRIYMIDDSGVSGLEIGARVRRKEDGMIGVLLKKESLDKILSDYPGASHWIRPTSIWRLQVKWKRGGTDYNVQDDEVEPVR